MESSHKTGGEGARGEAASPPEERGGNLVAGAAMEDMGDTAVIGVTERGVSLAVAIAGMIEKADIFVPEHLSSRVRAGHRAFSFPLAGLVGEAFCRYRRMVLILALGAAVRLLAPLVGDKRRDPGVVVVDEKGWNVISLLSGHLGAANALARELGAFLGARTVITTATDLYGLPALDLIVKERGWWCEDEDRLPGLVAAMLNDEEISVYQDDGEDLLEDLALHGVKAVAADPQRMAASGADRWKIIVSDLDYPELSGRWERNLVRIRPRQLVVGIGCRKNTPGDEIEAAFLDTLRRKHISPYGVSILATVDIKKEEKGLTAFAERWGLPIRYLSPWELQKAPSHSPPSPAATRVLGVTGVCEKAALSVSGGGSLLVPKTKCGKVTVAVAGMERKPPRTGDLKLVGIGPGDPGLVTPRAWRALLSSDAIVGYSAYIRQVEEMMAPPVTVPYSMGEEMERAQWAVDAAARGGKVCLVSGGDPGIYGMAGALGELLLSGKEVPEDLHVEVIPGVPAICAASALLGAPISNDFAVVSLSDYLTEWEVIEERLRSCARNDMIIVLYNPSSSRRRENLYRAARAIMDYREEGTPVGVVRNACRPTQEVSVIPLEGLRHLELGMDCLVVVGNSGTRVWKGRMFTPRGYSRRKR